jgi:transcriptional regulator with XRE-family HTH domain
MTHLQELFIRNLRLLRKKKGISQLKFSEMVNISPNYLNAVENGKNFPSPEVIQAISDTLGIVPYQLFLEYPIQMPADTAGEKDKKTDEKRLFVQELAQVKQKIINEIDKEVAGLIQKYGTGGQ